MPAARTPQSWPPPPFGRCPLLVPLVLQYLLYFCFLHSLRSCSSACCEEAVGLTNCGTHGLLVAHGLTLAEVCTRNVEEQLLTLRVASFSLWFGLCCGRRQQDQRAKCESSGLESTLWWRQRRGCPPPRASESQKKSLRGLPLPSAQFFHLRMRHSSCGAYESADA